jgi:mono/diheme cytochrome c family protein
MNKLPPGFLSLFAVLGFPLYSAGTCAQNAAAVAAGQTVFQLRCAPCHGSDRGADPSHPLLPGTDALRIKYRGRLPALLEQRTDLPATVLGAFVRHGTWSMPPFRKTEISDADIDNIAAYLAMTAKRAGR